MIGRKVSALVVLTSALLAACGGPQFTVQVEPIDAYRAYEDFQPEQDKALLAKSLTVDPGARPVRIFQEAFPKGIELKGNAFGVAPGYRHRLIGKFAYSPGKEVPKTELVARVKKLAIAAGGDAAIVLFLATSSKSFEIAQGVEAIIVKLDERMESDAGSPEKPSLPPGTNGTSL